MNKQFDLLDDNPAGNVSNQHQGVGSQASPRSKIDLHLYINADNKTWTRRTDDTRQGVL